jgi:hypothetical protein
MQLLLLLLAKHLLSRMQTMQLAAAAVASAATLPCRCQTGQIMVCCAALCQLMWECALVAAVAATARLHAWDLGAWQALLVQMLLLASSAQLWRVTHKCQSLFHRHSV